MSRFAGVFRLDGAPVGAPALERMGAALARRGAAGGGTWLQGSVGLAGRDDAEPHGPPVRRGHLVAVADLRLDNREDLGAALGLTPGDLAGLGDAALLLHAWDAWGEACPARLRGDFAFVIWDARRRVLACARDPFGARPLVYTRTSRLFAFASDTRGLHALDELPRRRDDARIADFLLDADLETIDATSTFYLDVFRLAPATVLTVADGTVAIRRYWRPTAVAGGPSGTAAAQALRSALQEAVRRRTRGRDTGAMLSGGIDSTAIVALARHDGNVRTFSAVGDAGEVPDTAYVDATVAQGGIDPTYVRPSDVPRFAERVRHFLEASDDPYDAYSCALPLLVYAAAAEAGVRTVLDGVDGDLVTCPAGNGLLPSLRSGDVRGAWRRAGAAARHYGDARLRLLVADGLAPWAWSGIRPLLPAAALASLRAARRARTVSAAARVSAIHPDLLRAVAPEARLERMYLAREREVAGEGPAAEHAANLAWAGVPASLERYDRAAASQGLTASHPFFDRGVVDLCLSIGWSDKAGDGTPKPLLRAALADDLPTIVRERRWSLSPHTAFKQALVRALAPWARARLDALGGASGRVDPRAVEHAWRRWQAGDGSQADLLLELATLSAWLG